MSSIIIPAFPPAAKLGDVLDLQPADARFAYTYAVTSKPGGSVAAFSGSTVTPDVAGSYTFTVTAGTDVLSVTCWVYAVAIYNSLNVVSPSAGRAPSDAQIRSILSAVAASGTLTAAQLAAWNTGTYPASPFNLARFGG